MLYVFMSGGSVMAFSAEVDSGITTIESHHTIEQTMERLQTSLEAHKVRIFAIIDFSGDAANEGLTLRPEKLLVFGNPKAGTSLMQVAPTAGLDLPFKALVWEDADHRVWVSYNEPRYIAGRHRMKSEDVAIFSSLLILIAQAAQP
jgi:uncharacterized protein (DUF302 family)